MAQPGNSFAITKILCEFLLIDFLFSVVVIGNSVNVVENEVKWVDVNTSMGYYEATMKFEPAGEEHNLFQFPCRAKYEDVENVMVPGKLTYTSCEKYEEQPACYIPVEDVVHIGFKDFQVLVSPPGAVSWVFASNLVVSENAVVGGDFPSGGPALVCRATHNAGIAVGAYSPKDGKCYYVKECSLTPAESFEILVLNKHEISNRIET